MDIEKMYNDIKNQINETTNLEENTYMQQLLKQDKLYYTQLDSVIQTYPTSKLSDTDTVYTTQLSALNGISKTIKNLDASLHDKVLQNTRKMQQSETEITNLKQMYSNLDKNDGDMEKLDLTSRRLLTDYVNIYSTNRLVLWIKVIIVGFLSYILFSDAMKYPELRIYILLWGICIILLFVISYFRYKWATRTSLPTSATSQPESVKTCSDIPPSLTCSATEYGCCPDGVTVSDKNKLNCGS